MTILNVIFLKIEPLDTAYTLGNFVDFVGKYERGKKIKSIVVANYLPFKVARSCTNWTWLLEAKLDTTSGTPLPWFCEL